MASSRERIVRIGSFSGMWGDTETAVPQLLSKGGHLDYLVGDYLAELTMVILARSLKKGANQRGGAGEGGYIAEFVSKVFVPNMTAIHDRNLKIVVNAGGLNPHGLKVAVEQAAQKAGAPVPVVAAVSGDGLGSKFWKMHEEGHITKFAVNDEEESLPPVGTSLLACNAYLGAFAIAEALDKGAQIVITGRTVDSAMVLGPLIHEFGWSRKQYDLLAAGSLAGHIVECGCQCTGGNFTDWRDSSWKGWEDVGFPIVECASDGTFVVTKPGDTGGLVTVGTVAEQILYETLDPGAYYLPDVIGDWRNVQLVEVGPTDKRGGAGSDRVLVTGVKGRPPSPYYKVGIAYLAGFFTSNLVPFVVTGYDAKEKAEKLVESILARSNRLLTAANLGPWLSFNVEMLGAGGVFGPHVSSNGREVVVRLSLAHKNPKAFGVLRRELAPFALGGPPGLFGPGQFASKPIPAVKYASCLVDKAAVPVVLNVGNIPSVSSIDPVSSGFSALVPDVKMQGKPGRLPRHGRTSRVPLLALCYGRSGDKGNCCNIGLIARDPKFYAFICAIVTPEAVKKHMGHLLRGSVKRFEVPGFFAVNFVATDALGGGGSSSMSADRQGKCYAQLLLTMEVDAPAAWVANSPYKLSGKARL